MKVNVLIPVYNDWESCAELIQQAMQDVALASDNELVFFIVNDGSTEDMPATGSLTSSNVKIIHLNRNVGHQRAIALGLSYLNDHSVCDFVVVMDGDGEDKPSDINSLLKEALVQKNKIIFGTRNRRYEGFWFRFFYFWYKHFFRILTGQKISFGNFCAIPFNRLKNLVFVSELWNHFSGGIIRSRIPYSSLPLDRGKRYFGQSKMNFIALVIHGLSAISVYTDTLAVRILLSTFTLICIALTGIVVVTAIRFLTPLAIPGWASFVVLSFLIIIFQAFLISLLLVFNVLNYRTQRHFIPAIEYKKFIQSAP